MAPTFLRMLFILATAAGLISCGSLRTFHEYARVGDTVAIPVGMKPGFSKDNITVTLTPSSGPQIVLPATDPAIRAVINLYPDPVSSMRISKELGQDLTPFARTYFDAMNTTANNDQDMYQTTVFLDIPATLLGYEGLLSVDISNGTQTHTATLDIIPGAGSPNTFDSDFDGGLLLDGNMLDSLARTDHATINISSPLGVPAAVELELTHDGTGTPFVVNPTGVRKSIFWSDNGTTIKIIMMGAKDNLINRVSDYKIYIAGTVSNLQLGQAKGYNANGEEILNVAPSIQFSN